MVVRGDKTREEVAAERGCEEGERIHSREAKGPGGQNCRRGVGGMAPGAKRQAAATAALATKSEAPVGWSSGAIRATRHKD